MDSLWDNLIRNYGTQCARAREDLMRARTADEVVRVVCSPARPELMQGQPPTPEEMLLKGMGAAMIEAIHRHAVMILHSVGSTEFEDALRWHRTYNLEPCRLLYPQLHDDFEMKLQRAACTRWMLEMRVSSQAVH
jgi:hypothetical protein